MTVVYRNLLLTNANLIAIRESSSRKLKRLNTLPKTGRVRIRSENNQLFGNSSFRDAISLERFKRVERSRCIVWFDYAPVYRRLEAFHVRPSTLSWHYRNHFSATSSGQLEHYLVNLQIFFKIFLYAVLRFTCKQRIYNSSCKKLHVPATDSASPILESRNGSYNMCCVFW